MKTQATPLKLEISDMRDTLVVYTKDREVKFYCETETFAQAMEVVKAVNRDHLFDELADSLESAIRWMRNNNAQCLRLDDFEETLERAKGEE